MQAVLIDGQVQVQGRPLGALDVGGISLARRAARSVFHAGGQRLLVLTPQPERYAKLVEHDRAAPLEVTCIEEHIDGLKAGLDALRRHFDKLDDVIWLIPGDRVLTPGLLRVLERPEHRRGVAALDAHGRLIAARLSKELLNEELLDGDRSLEEAVALLSEHQLIAVHHRQDPELIAVHSVADAKEAKRLLFRTLRKPLGRQTDGVTAYLINRPVSLACSRLLIHTPVTPNFITGANILLGLFAGYLIWGGGYAMMALGAFLFQMVSIFDGIDGELARLKLLMSKRGEWFDTIGDDIVKMAMFIGLGHAVYLQTSQQVFAAITIIGFLWTAFVVTTGYMEVSRTEKATLNNVQWWWEREGVPDNAWRKFLVGWGYLLKRDTYTLLLVLMVIFNLPALSLSLMFVGINIIFFAHVGQKALAWSRQAQQKPDSIKVT